jgi:AcrR family transcriptional regulator
MGLYTGPGTEYRIRVWVYHDPMATPANPAATIPAAPPSLRDRASRAVRTEVAEVALRLFLEQGFEKTTVDQIAAAAGLSRTSFFRYFATKEDVILGHLEELKQRLLESLAERPEQEPVWQSLRRAFDMLIGETVAMPERGLAMARMLHNTPSLKSRQLGKQLGWQDLLVPEIARRLGVADKTRDARPRALAAAAFGCLNAAVDVWTVSDGALDLSALLDQAMNAVSG